MTNLKKILLTIGILSVLFIFHEKLVLMAIDLIIDPLFEKFEPNLIYDFILLFLLPFNFLLWRLLSGFTKRISFDLKLFITCCLVVYTYLLSQNLLEFFHLKSSDQLRYADSIFIYIGIILIENIRSNYLVLINKRAESKDTYLSIDSPIQSWQEDAFNIKKDVDTIVNIIRYTKSNSSLAIGISGSWGTGKTSFINLVTNEINNEDRIEVIHFNPWLSHAKEALPNQLLNRFENSLSKYSSSIMWRLRDYERNIRSVDSSFWGWVVNIVSSPFFPKSIVKKFELINRELESLNIRVLVIMDDLDRLESTEVFESLKLIRNTFSFSNIVYLVAFDRNYIVKSLNGVTEGDSAGYLNKIFNHIHEFYPVSQNKLDEVFESVLSNYYPEATERLKTIQIGNKSIQRGIPQGTYDTLRDVIRISNTLILETKKVEAEIVVHEYFLVQLLRMKFPKIFIELFLRRNDYLTAENRALLANNLLYLNKDELDMLLSKYDSPIDKKIIKFIFHGLFPFDKDLTYRIIEPNSILYAVNFYNYFNSRIDSSKLPESAFREFLKKSVEELKDQLTIWVKEDKKLELYHRLNAQDLSELETRQEFENFLEAQFYLPYLENPDKFYSPGIDVKLLINKLNREEITTKYYQNKKDEYEAFLVQLMKSAPPNYTAHSSFLSTLTSKKNHVIPITNKLALEFNICYLKSYIESIESFSKSYIWDLYHHAFIIEEQLASQQIFDYQANKLLLNLIENAPLDFLREILTKYHPNEPKFGLSKIVKQIFGSKERFREFINETPLITDPVREEYNSFLDKLANEGNVEHVEFKFIELDIK